jgi:hypothetical protein
MSRILFILGLLSVLVSACAGGVSPQDMNQPLSSNPYQPQSGDDRLQHSDFYLDRIELRILDSNPLQYAVFVQAALPNPCCSPRATVSIPDAGNRIDILLYSVSDPSEDCTQVLEPVELTIPLGVLPPGHYTVWVNGGKVGEFDA